MLTVIAVDDQPLMLDAVKRVLKDLCFVKLIAATTNPEDALLYCESSKPHVALLDIDMPTLSGINLAEALATISPQTAIVFITSHTGYIRDAFKVYAYDFLEKPVDPARLTQTLKRLHQQRGDNEPALEVPTEEGVALIKPSQIVLAEATGRTCELVMCGGAGGAGGSGGAGGAGGAGAGSQGANLQVKLSFKELDALLETYPQFFKSSRSFIVNLHFVKAVERLNRTSFEIHMKDTKHFAQLSKNLYDDFRSSWSKAVADQA